MDDLIQLIKKWYLENSGTEKCDICDHDRVIYQSKYIDGVFGNYCSHCGELRVNNYINYEQENNICPYCGDIVRFEDEDFNNYLVCDEEVCEKKAHRSCVESICSKCKVWVCDEHAGNSYECEACGRYHDIDCIVSLDKDFKDLFGIVCNDCFYNDDDSESTSTNIGEVSLNFYTINWKGQLPADIAYPCIVLMGDSWDDFGYRTYFHVYYYDSSAQKTELGGTKILDLENLHTRLPKHFKKLPENFCSLGQSYEYYELISKMGSFLNENILTSLNDILFNKAIEAKFISIRGFSESLLRFSEARNIYEKSSTNQIESSLNFSFSCQVTGAEKEHKINFDFEENVLPHRINALVGKNATGKTKVMTELAGYLSGTKENNFIAQKPSFSKIIAISYSAFDEFNKPFELSDKEIETRKDEVVFFSYVYCGLRTSKGLVSEDDIATNFISAYNEVKNRNRQGKWEKIIRNLIEYDNDSLINKITKASSNFSSFLSSGQQILLFTITQVIANIEEESLLLFDEPELHLHPNAISNFMRMFYEILNTFNSYAIVATHSPLIIQEIPSKYIRVFSRIGNITEIDKPFLECFGENVSNITNDIFEVREHESNYKTYFRMVADDYSKEEIIDFFKDDLSFNALTYLNSLYLNKEKRRD